LEQVAESVVDVAHRVWLLQL